MRKTVLLSAPYMIPVIGLFMDTFNKYDLDIIIPDVNERLEEHEIMQYAGQFDGTICGDDKYSRGVIEACLPRLKVISKWGTGIDSIDQQAAEEYNVMVRNTPGAFTDPVADSVIGYILAFSRNIHSLDDAMKAGDWEKIPGKALNECVLGVVGVGRIGKAVIKRAKSFGMKVIGNDIIDIDSEFIESHNVEMLSLNQLLEQSDYVSINCDLNPTSKKLLAQPQFGIINPKAILINTARGPIIDETAMIEALKSKQIKGAALDVFEVEPLPINSPLRKMGNVLLSPHNTNSSPKAWDKVHENSIRNLLMGLGLIEVEL